MEGGARRDDDEPVGGESFGIEDASRVVLRCREDDEGEDDSAAIVVCCRSRCLARSPLLIALVSVRPGGTNGTNTRCVAVRHSQPSIVEARCWASAFAVTAWHAAERSTGVSDISLATDGAVVVVIRSLRRRSGHFEFVWRCSLYASASDVPE